MNVGDLVRCIEGACMSVDGGVGIVVQIEEYDPDQLSICVQWPGDFLWYEEKDLEVINDSYV
jgi:hypothetical protein